MTNGPQSGTVFLVDDDPSILRALGRLLKSAGLRVAAYQSAQAFLEQQEHPRIGCVVLDVTMPGMTGPQLQAVLARTANSLPIIFLTGDGDLPTGIAAMKAGAVDFLSKPCPEAVLLDAVHRALAVDRKRRVERRDEIALKELFETLTPREHDVMLCVVAGHLNKRIAEQLSLAEATVKIHRARVMAKLGVESLADLVRLNERAKIIRDIGRGSSRPALDR